MINAGDFRHTIIFQQPSGGTDDEGFPIVDPIEYTKAKARLKTLRGSLFYQASTENMQHNREFTIRYQRKLDEEQRPENLELVYKGKTHKIESIENDDGLNKTMTVIAQVVV